MKTKLGGTEKVKGLKYEGYKTLLKKTLKELVASDQDEGPNFVMIDGNKLPWADGNAAEKPLLYLGDIKGWKADIKKLGLDLKEFAFGQTKIVLDEGKVQVNLVTAKGKFTAPANLKPVKKLFATKFKPKILLEVVSSLDSIEETSEQTPSSPENTTETPEKITDESTDNTVDLKELGKTIVSDFKPLQSQYEKETAEETFSRVHRWIALYKSADNALKASVKDLGTTIQKVGTYLKKVIQIDQQIEKEIPPLYKKIDQHNELVERGNDQAQELSVSLDETFARLTNMASEIKDQEFLSVLKDFRSEIK